MGFSDYCSDGCEMPGRCDEPCRMARDSSAAWLRGPGAQLAPEPSEYDRRAERERESVIAALNDGGYGDEAPPSVRLAELGILPPIRTFDTGATRDTDAGKPDYEAYLSPQVIARFGAYMLEHSRQSDGTVRAGDNWQKGIPFDAYMKSAWRHLVEAWTLHRGDDADDQLEDALCALLFNVSGYLHELLKARA